MEDKKPSLGVVIMRHSSDNTGIQPDVEPRPLIFT